MRSGATYGKEGISLQIEALRPIRLLEIRM